MKKKGLIAVIALLLMATPLWAGWPSGPKGRRWKDFEMLRMWRLTQELDLSEEEAAKVFPLLKRYSQKRRDLQLKRRKLLRELQELLDEGTTRERLSEKMGEIEKVTRELEETRWEEWERLKEILPPRKQARYLLFHHRFVKDLWRIMRKPGEPPPR